MTEPDTSTDTDTSRTLEFYASPTRQLTLLSFSAMSIAVAAALAFRLFPDMPNDPAAVSAGYSGLAFFGLCAAVAVWRLVAQRGAIVTLSPAGLRDVRVAAEPIPWRAIKRISTWQLQRQMVLVVAVDPAFEASLTLTRLARWTRSAHRSLGADGLVVSAYGLKVSYVTLYYACLDYWTAWRDRS
ncbi:MAG: hypothetical protein IT536_01545 [Hyphomicrobiales bacterium]|nr:hypothetical protein [Hyphomicrobiales bacterium]